MAHSNPSDTPTSKTASTGERREGKSSYRILDDESVTEAIIRAVSSEVQRDRTELKPLFSIVDTDALNALFAPREDGTPRQTNGTVAFDYSGYRVQVRNDGTVELDRSQ